MWNKLGIDLYLIHLVRSQFFLELSSPKGSFCAWIDITQFVWSLNNEKMVKMGCWWSLCTHLKHQWASEFVPLLACNHPFKGLCTSDALQQCFRYSCHWHHSWVHIVDKSFSSLLLGLDGCTGVRWWFAVVSKTTQPVLTGRSHSLGSSTLHLHR